MKSASGPPSPRPWSILGVMRRRRSLRCRCLGLRCLRIILTTAGVPPERGTEPSMIRALCTWRMNHGLQADREDGHYMESQAKYCDVESAQRFDSCVTQPLHAVAK
jgi:hypothetical protein